MLELDDYKRVCWSNQWTDENFDDVVSLYSEEDIDTLVRSVAEDVLKHINIVKGISIFFDDDLPFIEAIQRYARVIDSKYGINTLATIDNTTKLGRCVIVRVVDEVSSKSDLHKSEAIACALLFGVNALQ